MMWKPEILQKPEKYETMIRDTGFKHMHDLPVIVFAYMRIYVVSASVLGLVER